MGTFERSGYARSGKVDWNRLEAFVRRTDVFALLRTLAERYPI